MASRERRLNWLAIKNALRIYSVELKSFESYVPEGPRRHALVIDDRIMLWVAAYHGTDTLLTQIFYARQGYDQRHR